MHIEHVGHSVLHSNSLNTTFHLKNLIHVPIINKNLVNVSKFAKDNHVFFEFHPEYCVVKSQVTKKIVLRGQLRDGLYVFDNISIGKNHVPCNYVAFPCTASQFLCNIASVSNSFSLWHQRLGQCGANILSHVLNSCNISVPLNKENFVCTACCMGKSHQLPFSHSTTKFSQPLELVFSDIWGPASLDSRTGNRYYICFIDAFSRYVCLYLLKSISQAFQAFLQYKSFMELQTGLKTKALQTDNVCFCSVSANKWHLLSTYLSLHPPTKWLY